MSMSDRETLVRGVESNHRPRPYQGSARAPHRGDRLDCRGAVRRGCMRQSGDDRQGHTPDGSPWQEHDIEEPREAKTSEGAVAGNVEIAFSITPASPGPKSPRSISRRR